MKVTTNAYGSDMPALECPFSTDKCVEHCVHIESVRVNAGGKITDVTRDGTKLSEGEPAGRGVRIEIVYWCEAMHKWKVVQQFHKGSVFVTETLLVDAPEGFDEGGVEVGDLWRD